jgi:hypothetical protein
MVPPEIRGAELVGDPLASHAPNPGFILLQRMLLMSALAQHWLRCFVWGLLLFYNPPVSVCVGCHLTSAGTSSGKGGTSTTSMRGQVWSGQQQAYEVVTAGMQNQASAPPAPPTAGVRGMASAAARNPLAAGSFVPITICEYVVRLAMHSVMPMASQVPVTMCEHVHLEIPCLSYLSSVALFTCIVLQPDFHSVFVFAPTAHTHLLLALLQVQHGERGAAGPHPLSSPAAMLHSLRRNDHHAHQHRCKHHAPSIARGGLAAKHHQYQLLFLHRRSVVTWQHGKNRQQHLHKSSRGPMLVCACKPQLTDATCVLQVDHSW